MAKKERPIGVDLFAGAGGMTLGFEQAGFDVLAAVELDPIHCATHEFNFPFWSIFCQSVVDIKEEDIRKQTAIGNREIDVVFGGPPCQGFSMMGKRALDDPRNTLVFHFMRLVLELRPKYFVMENVLGITLGEHQKFLLEIIEKFSVNGYEVERNYQILNAVNYGVPQNRARLFLIGCRLGLPLPKYPEPQAKAPTVWEAIGDLPALELYPELLLRDWAIVKYKKPGEYAAKLRGIIPQVKDYSYQRDFDKKILSSSLRTQHQPLTLQRFADTKWGETEKISHFYKLHPNGVCNTLRAGTASNRGAFTSPRPIHPYQPRCITVREAARLHSYPDWFRFHVTKWHGLRQVGNSVPPLLAKAVAAEVIGALGVKPIKIKGKMQLGKEDLLEMNMSQAAQRYGVHLHVIEPRKRGFQVTVDG